MSNGKPAAHDGGTIRIGGTDYAKGVAVHATSKLGVNLQGLCSEFGAQVGIDDEIGDQGCVVFQIWADGAQLYDSGVVTGSMPAQPVNVPLDGKQELTLVVTSAGDGVDYDHADWADARILCASM